MFLGCMFDKDKTQLLKLLFTDKNNLCRANLKKDDKTVFKT